MYVYKAKTDICFSLLKQTCKKIKSHEFFTDTYSSGNYVGTKYAFVCR